VRRFGLRVVPVPEHGDLEFGHFLLDSRPWMT